MPYEHLTVRGEEPWAGRFMGERPTFTTDESPPRTFATPDEALRVLGAEGWQCIHFFQDDGPRQPVIPMSLIQAPAWPKSWVIRFQRETSS